MKAALLFSTPISIPFTHPLWEACQAGVWSLFVSHPKLKEKATKWESTNETRGVIDTNNLPL